MVGGRTERGSRRRTRAASVVVPFPRSATGDRPDLARFVPSGRSLLLGVAILCGVLAAYWGALASSVFAVERIEVKGDVPSAVAKQVRAATSDLLGSSLVSVNAGEVEALIRALPTIAGVSIDRSFPHTLVIKVAAERPVAVARVGRTAWLVSGSGKVIREIELGTERTFPRVWLPRDVDVAAGRFLPTEVLPAARALAAVQTVGLRRRAKAVRTNGGQLTVVLRSGPEIRLGDARDVLLKLTVAARVFPALAEGTAYVDVSVPERPVASTSFNP
ncbi:MAG TPA: FtsQ-type POTRA domain-containing protein [Gaiellaceae bacterium]|nr:FtsQ-type POTRA domain-containing protein [Gaiellaceae bacterium]